MKKISVAPENPQYRIVEIFESLQGEGRNTGMPAVFVRLGKCNLACGWCDTDYLTFGMMSLSDILGCLKTYAARNIIITGGEPTIQPHLDMLLDTLKAEGYFLCLETNGLKPAPPSMKPTASPKPTKYGLLPTAMSLRFAKIWNAKSVRAITIFLPANKTA